MFFHYKRFMYQLTLFLPSHNLQEGTWSGGGGRELRWGQWGAGKSGSSLEFWRLRRLKNESELFAEFQREALGERFIAAPRVHSRLVLNTETWTTYRPETG